jgi:fructosamine-3-kinase
MSSQADLSQAIATALNGPPPLQLTALHGGCVGEVYRATLGPDHPLGQPAVVVKVDHSAEPVLGIEGQMLRYLQTHSQLPVPTVYANSPHLLIMEWLDGEPNRLSVTAQEEAAEHIAALHQVRGAYFGFEWDTVIGGQPQPNPQSTHWIPFFAQYRIAAMAAAAYEAGALPLTVRVRLEQFAERAAQWLAEPPHPSLLHGDLWGGNILTRNKGRQICGYIDPAIYYGHPEMDLAFSTMFGTFDTPFFNRYQEINPVEPEFFQLRRDLYNLYPYLVHVRLFGSSYVPPIEQTLRRIGL